MRIPFDYETRLRALKAKSAMAFAHFVLSVGAILTYTGGAAGYFPFDVEAANLTIVSLTLIVILGYACTRSAYWFQTWQRRKTNRAYAVNVVEARRLFFSSLAGVFISGLCAGISIGQLIRYVAAKVGVIIPAALIGLLTICSPTATHAGDWSAIVNGKAVHMGAPRSYNEANYGLGVQYDFDGNDKWYPYLTASGFLDSERNLSYYAGGGFMRRIVSARDANDWHAEAGFVAFFMTRKTYLDGRVFPGALPAATIGKGRVAVNITYAPKLDETMAPFWFFQLKVTP